MKSATGELATLEAVESFAASIRSLEDFDSLFAAIEAIGIPLGVDRRLRTMALIARLGRTGARLELPQEVKAFLLPVLTRSQHEEAEVGPIIDEWLAGRLRSAVPSRRRLQLHPADSPVPQSVQLMVRAERTAWITAAVVFGGILLALAVLLLSKLGAGAPGTIAAAGEIARYSAPILTLPLSLSPAIQALAEDVLSRLLFGIAVLIIGILYAEWRKETRSRLSRRIGETDLVETFGTLAPVPNWFRTSEARVTFDRLKRTRFFATNRIDVLPTIASTIRAAGRPSIVWQRRRERPTYVLIVERNSTGDFSDFLADLIEAAIRAADVFYTRYNFTGRLDRLHQVRGGSVDPEFHPFSVVATRHAGERLIFVGSGMALFEAPGVRRNRAGIKSILRPGTPVPELLHAREFKIHIESDTAGHVGRKRTIS
jgi:hypothetical protein